MFDRIKIVVPIFKNINISGLKGLFPLTNNSFKNIQQQLDACCSVVKSHFLATLQLRMESRIT